jgi:hypothetical protein
VLNNSNVRKGTALFAMLLLVSLNVGSLRWAWYEITQNSTIYGFKKVT